MLWRPGSPNDAYTDPNNTGPQEWVKQPDGRADYSLDESNTDGPQTLKFRVKVNADQAGQTISNEARFTLTGVKSNLSLGNSGSAAVEVARPVPGSFGSGAPLQWSGTLQPGQTATVSYQMKTKPDIAIPGEVSNTLVPGDKGTIAPDNLLSWSGNLGVGETAVISYKLKVKADLATPGEIRNAVLPGDRGVCETGKCTTVTTVPEAGTYSLEKTADKKIAKPGEIITYTVKVTQSGEAPVNTSFVDDLAKVVGASDVAGSATADKGRIAADNPVNWSGTLAKISSADYVVGSATADKGSLSGALNWSGTLAKGEVATISYQMKIKTDVQTPAEAKNLVVPGGEGSCQPGKCETTTTVSTPSGFQVQKLVDLETAAPGDTIMFQITVAQTGDGTVDAAFTDDLSTVAGAQLVPGSITVNQGTVAADNPIKWSGTLAKGEVATVMFLMKVNADISTPGAVLNQAVSGVNGVCAPAGCDTVTRVLTPGTFTVEKTATPASVVPGDLVSYTIKVTQ